MKFECLVGTNEEFGGNPDAGWSKIEPDMIDLGWYRYRGVLTDEFWNAYQCYLELVGAFQTSGFQRMEKGWIVQRTVSWFSWYRRLNLDYQRDPSTAENFVYMAMIRLMLKRLKSIFKQVLSQICLLLREAKSPPDDHFTGWLVTVWFAAWLIVSFWPTSSMIEAWTEPPSPISNIGR